MKSPPHKKQNNKNEVSGNAFPKKQIQTLSTSPLIDNRSESIAQRKLREKANNSPQVLQQKALQKQINSSPEMASQRQQVNEVQGKIIQKVANNTGMPDQLKSGIENLSGMDMSDVRVHYNSPKPATIQAHAYAQGTNIHLGPGQEKYLPHEAWHTVQQKQGRVKPTMQMKGKVNVNDDQGLEQEADEMGTLALSTGANESIPLQKKSQSTDVVQRKVNDLTNPFRTFFLDYLSPGVSEDVNIKITRYNRVDANHKQAKEYVTQIAYLKSINEKDPAAFGQVRGKIERILGDVDEEVEHLNAQNEVTRRNIRNKTEEIEAIQRRIHVIETAEREPSVPLPEEHGRLQEEVERLRIEKEVIESTLASREQEIRRQTAKHAAIASLRDEIPAKEHDLTTELNAEITAVKDQVRTDASEATLPKIEAEAGGYFHNFAPRKINSLIESLNKAPNPIAKFPIILELDQRIEAWKNSHTDPNGLKDKYKNTDERHEVKLEIIKRIEHQLQFTRNTVMESVFSGDVPDMPAGEGMLKETGVLGKEAGGMLATTARGSRFTGGAAGSKGLTGAIDNDKKEGADTSLIDGLKMDPKALVELSEKLKIAGAGANGVGQLFKLIEVGYEWKKVKNGGGLMDFIKALSDSIDLGTTTAAEVTMIGENVTRLKEGKGVDSTNSWSASAMETQVIAQSIFALKNLAMGIMSLVKAYQRAGIDKEAMWTHTLEGGLSLTRAIVAGMRTVSTIQQHINHVVPPWARAVIPPVSLALNFIQLIEAAYRTHRGRLTQNAMTDRLNKLTGMASPIHGLLESKTITRDETRGVLGLPLIGKATRKSYQRFHPLVMSKIDDHKEGDGDISVGLHTDDEGVMESEQLDDAKIQAIREYEYISKMIEINQKRKVKGGLDIIKSIVSAAGDIATMSHAGIIAGVAVNASVSGGTLLHSGSKFAQKIYRGKTAPKSDLSTLDSIEAHDAEPDRGGKIDKSSGQKQTEYYRHSLFILDKLSHLSIRGQSDEDISAAVTEFKETKQLLDATGVDYYEFINAKDMAAHVKLLINAMKSGR